MPPVRLSPAALMTFAILALGSFGDPFLSGDLFVSTANAQSQLQEWIDRLRHGAMPDGIAKTNGRIEATQIDVAAKYAGRLASVNVNEGDEVTAGQEIARVASPETEAEKNGI